MSLFPKSLMILTILMVTGCSGSGGGAGHWFHIIFVIIPGAIIFYLINKKIDEIQETLDRHGDKLSNLSSRMDKESKIKKQ